MDKYEYRIKAEQIRKLAEQEDFASAMKIANTIDWNRVRSIPMLCLVGEIYEKNNMLEESRDVMLIAYDRHPYGRMIIYSLAELSIRLEDYIDAVEYYKEFVQVAPRDTGRYILQYQLYEAQHVGLQERIAVLEEFKRHEYIEKWAFELAYLYHRAGMSDKCVSECDELILWFSEGKYVEKAIELKMIYAPLTKEQKEKYESRNDVQIEKSIAAVEAVAEKVPEQEEIQVKPLNYGIYDTVNLQKELAKSMQQIMEVADEADVEATMDNVKKIVQESKIDEVVEEKTVPSETVELDEEEEENSLEDKEVVTEAAKLINQITGSSKETTTENNVFVSEEPEVRQYESQEELGNTKVFVFDINDAPTKIIPVKEIEKELEKQNKVEEQKETFVEIPKEEPEVKSKEDGNSSIGVSEKEMIEKQITGQMSIEEVLQEWERMKAQVEEEKTQKIMDDSREEVETGKESPLLSIIETKPVFEEIKEELTTEDDSELELEELEAEENVELEVVDDSEEEIHEIDSSDEDSLAALKAMREEVSINSVEIAEAKEEAEIQKVSEEFFNEETDEELFEEEEFTEDETDEELFEEEEFTDEETDEELFEEEEFAEDETDEELFEEEEFTEEKTDEENSEEKIEEGKIFEEDSEEDEELFEEDIEDELRSLLSKGTLEENFEQKDEEEELLEEEIQEALRGLLKKEISEEIEEVEEKSGEDEVLEELEEEYEEEEFLEEELEEELRGLLKKETSEEVYDEEILEESEAVEDDDVIEELEEELRGLLRKETSEKVCDEEISEEIEVVADNNMTEGLEEEYEDELSEEELQEELRGLLKKETSEKAYDEEFPKEPEEIENGEISEELEEEYEDELSEEELQEELKGLLKKETSEKVYDKEISEETEVVTEELEEEYEDELSEEELQEELRGILKKEASEKVYNEEILEEELETDEILKEDEEEWKDDIEILEELKEELEEDVEASEELEEEREEVEASEELEEELEEDMETLEKLKEELEEVEASEELEEELEEVEASEELEEQLENEEKLEIQKEESKYSQEQPVANFRSGEQETLQKNIVELEYEVVDSSDEYEMVKDKSTEFEFEFEDLEDAIMREAQSALLAMKKAQDEKEEQEFLNEEERYLGEDEENAYWAEGYKDAATLEGANSAEIHSDLEDEIHEFEEDGVQEFETENYKEEICEEKETSGTEAYEEEESSGTEVYEEEETSETEACEEEETSETEAYEVEKTPEEYSEMQEETYAEESIKVEEYGEQLYAQDEIENEELQETEEDAVEEIEAKLVASLPEGIESISGQVEEDDNEPFVLEANAESFKKMFKYFTEIEGVSEQIVDALESIDEISDKGNVIIMGDTATGKTTLAVDIIRAAKKSKNITGNKIARISGEAMNSKDMGQVIASSVDGVLIVEEAANMTAETMDYFSRVLDETEEKILVILEDSKERMLLLLEQNNEFREKFTAIIDLPPYTNTDLVSFAKSYAKEKGFEIEEMGILALYSKLAEMQYETDFIPTLYNVKELIDEAIDKAGKQKVKNTFGKLFGRKKEEAQGKMLREKDFL